MTNEECNNSRKCMGNVSLLLESKGIMNLGYLFVKLLLRTGTGREPDKKLAGEADNSHGGL